MTAPEIPTSAKSLIKQLSNCVPAWSHVVSHSTGQCEFTTYGESRGDGTRPLIKVNEDVDSVLIQGRHVDGRAFVALWVHRHGDLTPAGGRKWKLDMAWRGRRFDEHTPKQISATELKTYVAPAPEMEMAA